MCVCVCVCGWVVVCVCVYIYVHCYRFVIKYHQLTLQASKQLYRFVVT